MRYGTLLGACLGWVLIGGCAAPGWSWRPTEEPIYLRPLHLRLEDRDFKATGQLYRPRAANGDAPGVLLLHGRLDEQTAQTLHGLCMALASYDLPIARLDVSTVKRLPAARKPVGEGPYEMGMSALGRLQTANMIRRKYLILAATPDQIELALRLRQKLYYDCAALIVITGAPISDRLPALPLSLDPYPDSLLVWVGGQTQIDPVGLRDKLPAAVSRGRVGKLIVGDWSLETIPPKREYMAPQYRLEARTCQALFDSISAAVAAHQPRPRR